MDETVKNMELKINYMRHSSQHAAYIKLEPNKFPTQKYTGSTAKSQRSEHVSIFLVRYSLWGPSSV